MTGKVTLAHLIHSAARSRFLCDIVDHTDRSRLRPVIVSLTPAGGLHADMSDREVPAYALGARGRASYPASVLRLRALLSAQRVDILHAHLFEPTLLAMAATIRLTRPIRVYTRHHADFWRVSDIAPWKRTAILMLERFAASRAHAIIAPSRTVRDELEREGAVSSKVHVIPYGFDFGRLTAVDTAAIDRARRELRTSEGFGAAIVGRLSPEKNHILLLRAWRLVLERQPNARLLVVGDGPLRPELERYSAELGTASAVVFTGWREDAAAVMGACDVIIHPGVTEAFQQVVVEALAQAKPLVATQVGMVGEHLRDGEHYMAVVADDPRSIAVAIEAIASRPHEARAMGERGRALVRARFDIATMVRRYEALYAELLAALREPPIRPSAI